MSKKRSHKAVNGSKFALSKHKLMKLVLMGATNETTSKTLNVSLTTAHRWKMALLEEQGVLTDERIRNLKRDFVATSLSHIKMCKSELSKLLATEDGKGKVGAIRAMNDTIKTESDLLSKLRIIEPEIVEQTGTTNLNHAIIKVIQTDDKTIRDETE